MILFIFNNKIFKIQYSDLTNHIAKYANKKYKFPLIFFFELHKITDSEVMKKY